MVETFRNLLHRLRHTVTVSCVQLRDIHDRPTTTCLSNHTQFGRIGNKLENARNLAWFLLLCAPVLLLEGFFLTAQIYVLKVEYVLNLALVFLQFLQALLALALGLQAAFVSRQSNFSGDANAKSIIPNTAGTDRLWLLIGLAGSVVSVVLATLAYDAAQNEATISCPDASGGINGRQCTRITVSG